jgi:hypothetical protein
LIVAHVNFVAPLFPLLSRVLKYLLKSGEFTLYTTPAVYLYLDRMQSRLRGRKTDRFRPLDDMQGTAAE